MSQQADKSGTSTDSTKLSSSSADRSTGTSGELGSASTAEPQGSSALGDSNFAGMSTTSQAKSSADSSSGASAGQGVGGSGAGQGGASQPWSSSSAAP